MPADPFDPFVASLPPEQREAAQRVIDDVKAHMGPPRVLMLEATCPRCDHVITFPHGATRAPDEMIPGHGPCFDTWVLVLDHVPFEGCPRMVGPFESRPAAFAWANHWPNWSGHATSLTLPEVPDAPAPR